MTDEAKTEDLNKLLHVLAYLTDPDTIYALLQDLFTLREIRDISQRFAVAEMLQAGKSYKDVEQETGASATTIARVSKCLSAGAGGYVVALQTLHSSEDK